MSNNNLKIYNNANVVNWYKQLNEITLVEKIIFDKNKEFILNANVLDVGIGGGRTTNYLIDKCKKYIGIDYSVEFVNEVKKKFPKADIRCVDARDLTSFNESSFDYINFSFNGIDYVNLEDRVKIFKQINRVLKPDGIFFFSTHNKEHSSYNVFPWLNIRNKFIVNLKTFIKLLPFIPRHLTKKNKEVYLENYAIINDSAHNYSLLTFYSTPKFLTEQLLDYKFTSIELFLKTGEPSLDYKLDDWIFVTCKKSFT